MSDEQDYPYFTGMPEDVSYRLRSEGLIEAAEYALPKLRNWLRRPEHRGFRLASFELVEGQVMQALVQDGWRDVMLVWTPSGWERM